MAGSRPWRRCGSAAREQPDGAPERAVDGLLQAASSRSSKRPGGGPPELTTSRSRPPKAATAAATASAGPSGVDRSAGRATAAQPSGCGVEPVARPGGQPDRRTLRAQDLGDGAAESAAATPDQGACSGQS